MGLADEYTDDARFFPETISVHVNGYKDDIIYVSGNPRTSAQLKRAEVKKGVVQSEAECDEGHKHMRPVDPAIEGGKCAMPISNSGTFIGLTGLAVVSEQLVLATTNQHTVEGLDLSLHVECQPWITNALNHWDSDPDATGEVKQTDPSVSKLVPTSGFVNDWTFTGYRRLLKQPDLKFGSGNLAKNVMCYQENARPSEGIITQQSCCVSKAAPFLKKPTLCDYLTESGSTVSCPESPTPDQLDVQEEAECAAETCIRTTSGPGSSAWTQAQEMLKIATADYIAEMATVAQNLQAM